MATSAPSFAPPFCLFSAHRSTCHRPHPPHCRYQQKSAPFPQRDSVSHVAALSTGWTSSTVQGYWIYGNALLQCTPMAQPLPPCTMRRTITKCGEMVHELLSHQNLLPPCGGRRLIQNLIVLYSHMYSKSDATATIRTACRDGLGFRPPQSDVRM